jgi:hypothetical protein
MWNLLEGLRLGATLIKIRFRSNTQAKRGNDVLLKLSGDAAEGSVEPGADVVDRGNDGKRDPAAINPYSMTAARAKSL